MKNKISNGNSLQLLAPAGGVKGGQPYVVGSITGIAFADAPEGFQYTLVLKGEFSDMPKKTGEAWAIGDKLYCKDDSSEITKTSGAGYTYIGCATVARVNGDTTGTILLSV